ncbi:hypothetical protein N9772_07415, partial [Bacteroidia bacterium]|nr:hypothetical protein [Bacteroidia bacterium]
AYATSFGQNVPQGIAYQAVAVKDGAYSVAGQNPQAIYWSNKEIKVRFTIFDTYPNGSSQYSEVHTTSTDDYGVFNLIIGQGSGLSGDFTTIPWELGDAHLQVEIDFENKNTFTLTALEKFWSVPYAFVTNETGTSSTDSSLAALDSLNKALKAEIAALRLSDKDTVIGNELQTLSVTSDSVTISDGNTVVINHPANLDNDPANEIQSLTIKGDSLSISDGNTVVINHSANLDNDSTNEIQTISLIKDTLRLSNGGGGIALESIKTYVNSSSNASGKNGTIDDMWFGVNFKNTNLIHLHVDTGYFYVGKKIIRERPDGTIDTLFSVGNSGSTLWMRYPYIYSIYSGKRKIFHVDSGKIRDVSGALGTPLNFGNTVALGSGQYSYNYGNLFYYSFKNDTTFEISNPDYNRNNSNLQRYSPERINDSLVLVGSRIWKYSEDTIIPTNQTLPLQFRPMTANERYVIYDRLVRQSKGTSAGYWRTLRIYDVLTDKSRVIESISGASSSGSGYSFLGTSQNKALIKYSSTFLWLDLDNLTLVKKEYRGASVITSTSTFRGSSSATYPPRDMNKGCRAAYRRPGLKLGEETSSSGFKYEYYPNLNYTKPIEGSIWLHY